MKKRSTILVDCRNMPKDPVCVIEPHRISSVVKDSIRDFSKHEAQFLIGKNDYDKREAAAVYLSINAKPYDLYLGNINLENITKFCLDALDNACMMREVVNLENKFVVSGLNNILKSKKEHKKYSLTLIEIVHHFLSEPARYFSIFSEGLYDTTFDLLRSA